MKHYRPIANRVRPSRLQESLDLIVPNATNQRIKMMMEAGIIDKATTDINLSLDLSKLTTDELEKKRAEVMSRLATQPNSLISAN